MFPKLKSQRHIIHRMILDISRLLCFAYFGDELIGDRAQDLLIISIAVMAMCEGKPMTGSDIAVYLGIPRSTVGRRIVRLVREKHLTIKREGARSLIYVARINEEFILGNVIVMMERMTRAHADLAKMGNALVEK